MTTVPLYTTLRPHPHRIQVGWCSLGHWASELWDGICAFHWARIFAAQRRHTLRWYWVSYRWLLCLALVVVTWLLALLKLGDLIAALQGGIWP